ncbi:MAG: hypothetical protein LBD21_09870 [Tannerellaceae bacterium]|jgi:hypothetical protein|nr:hypothetical protein [Tannerellaceae bacterium]
MSEMAIKSDFEDILTRVQQMNDKYGQDWLKKLPDFNGSSILMKYHEHIYDIEEISNKDTENKKKLTHLLYHMMNQHVISFIELSNSIHEANLNKAFSAAVEEFKKLKGEGSYAWFSNMKLPTSFARNSNVEKYYKEFFEAFNDDNKDIEVRRIHLLYENLLHNKNVEQLTNLFIILLIEYLFGIESKVLLVKSNCKTEQLFHFSMNDIENCRGYLLDFALFYKPNEINGSKLFENHISLFADFCFEKEEENPPIDFNKQSVYRINDYNTFHILKGYYLSLWEKDRYIEYLEKDPVFSGDTKIKDTIELYKKDSLETLSFFEYWKRAKKADAILLNDNYGSTFNIFYKWDIYKKNLDSVHENKNKDNITLRKELFQYLVDFPTDKTDTEVETMFMNKFKLYILRNKKKKL